MEGTTDCWSARGGDRAAAENLEGFRGEYRQGNTTMEKGSWVGVLMAWPWGRDVGVVEVEGLPRLVFGRL